MTDQGTDESGEILKTDVLGRVKVRPERREELLDAFEASAMSGQSFAIHHGIKVQTIASWIQKLRSLVFGDGPSRPENSQQNIL